ncbi:hypothetical protein COOONC_24554 [Cooperia oncophora]
MVDLACAGEISYKGLGGTPFGPPPIAWIRSQSDTHMLMLQISDYLPNSLFYHAHKMIYRERIANYTEDGIQNKDVTKVEDTNYIQVS